MNRTIRLATLLIAALAAAGASAAQPQQGVTLRLTLQPGQVLVYRATADVDVRAHGRAGGDKRITQNDADLEIIFSLTAGEAASDGSVAVAMEILNLKMTTEMQIERKRLRVEMDAKGIRIYDGHRLIQDVAWGALNLPNAPDFPALLSGTFKTRMSSRAKIELLEDPNRLNRLLQGADFLQLLRAWVILPEAPIVKGGTWQADQPLIAVNPLRFKQIYTIHGTEKYTALAAVTHMKRRCLKVLVKGDWPKTEVGGEIEAEHRSTATAFVDFQTGVTLSTTISSTQRIETIADDDEPEAEFDVETRATITYIGGSKAYAHYKAQKTAE